jgi:hypothetical protein
MPPMQQVEYTGASLSPSRSCASPQYGFQRAEIVTRQFDELCFSSHAKKLQQNAPFSNYFVSRALVKALPLMLDSQKAVLWIQNEGKPDCAL